MILSTVSDVPTLNDQESAKGLIHETLVKAGDATLFCRSMGSGTPLIVVHGGPGLSQDYLLPEMSRLAKEHFVIFYDQRGCGQSKGGIDPNSITIATFTDDIEAIRKQFNLAKVSILGHSWGGLVAMQYTAMHPEQVDRLILSNTMPASSQDFCAFKRECGKRTIPLTSEISSIVQSPKFAAKDPDTVEKMNRTIFRTYCYQPEKADQLNLHMSREAHINGEKVNQAFQSKLLARYFDFFPSVKQIKVPTLIIHGDADPVPHKTAEHIHENIEHSNYVLMKNCGHFPHIEDPDTYFRHLEIFLNETSEPLRN